MRTSNKTPSNTYGAQYRRDTQTPGPCYITRASGDDETSDRKARSKARTKARSNGRAERRAFIESFAR